jgi:glycerophosphoryl diester phosphodiesterase
MISTYVQAGYTGLTVLAVFIVIAKLCTAVFPKLIYKHKPLGQLRSKVSTIGHRGSKLEGITENSIAAFSSAIKSGVDVIELDVWFSKDKQVTVFHDKTFARMTEEKCFASPMDLDYAQYPTLVEPVPGQPAEYSEKERTRVPLLREVLAITPSNVCMIIEFKQDSDELICAVAQLLTETDRIDKTFWFSLVEKINTKLRRFDSRIPTINSEIGMLKVLLYYYIGILPFMPIQDPVFGVTAEEVYIMLYIVLLRKLTLMGCAYYIFFPQQIPLARIQNNEIMKKVPVWLHHLLAKIVAGKPPSILIAPTLFSHLRSRGIPVWVLGVNSVDIFQVAVKSGATAVLTDRPKWLMDQISMNKTSFFRIEAT